MFNPTELGNVVFDGLEEYLAPLGGVFNLLQPPDEFIDVALGKPSYSLTHVASDRILQPLGPTSTR